MDFLPIIFMISVLEFSLGLEGPNVCSGLKQYVLTSKIKYQQPVTIRKYTWCLNIPPRCSSVHTEMREKWKVQTEHRSKTVTFCCPGFNETENKCIPKCPEGLTGEKCDEECANNTWGTSCHEQCKCPKNSICDPKNGLCICIDGWIGSGCDILKSTFTKKPQTSTTVDKSVKPLFDWSTPNLDHTTKPNTTIAISEQPRSTHPTTIKIITESTTIKTTTETTTNIPTNKTTLTTQIESPVTTSKPVPIPQDKDSPIVKILQKSTKDFTKKIVAKPTESSIISLTVLKSTASTARRKPIKPNKPDSDLVKITVNSGYKSPRTTSQLTVDPLKKPMASTQQPFIYTVVTTDIQTEEILHVLTEPEQITSVAGEEESDERRDDLYSAVSIAMGVAVALILVATIIVLVARFRRSSIDHTKKLDMDNMQTMLDVSEDELPSSYMRSVFHSPIPDLPMNTLPYIHDINKTRYSVPFMQPVVIHAVSPIMVENFRDILECHYDHPKPPRPTNFTQQRRVTFNAGYPVTEEAINALKLEHHTMSTFHVENVDPVYDEIPWKTSAEAVDDITTMSDEAVTEL